MVTGRRDELKPDQGHRTSESKLWQALCAATVAMGSEDPDTKAIAMAYKKATAEQEPKVSVGVQLREQTVQALRLQARLDCALGNMLVLDEQIRQLYERRDQFEAVVQQCKFEHAAATMKIDLLSKLVEGTPFQEGHVLAGVVDAKEQAWFYEDKVPVMLGSEPSKEEAIEENPPTPRNFESSQPGTGGVRKGPTMDGPTMGGSL